MSGALRTARSSPAGQALALACALLLAASPLSADVAQPPAATEGAPPQSAATLDPDLVAIPAPTIPVRGRILMKDGVTPVVGALLEMTGGIEGQTLSVASGSGGRFQLRLPPGDYRTRITRRFEIFEGAAVYRVPAGPAIEIDLLLLPDIEPPPQEPPRNGKGAAPGKKTPPAPAPPTIRSGPDPVPEKPRVVGTIVDITRTSALDGNRRWPEALGFLGSLLAILVVAD